MRKGNIWLQGAVGTDPHNYVTQPFDHNLDEMAKYLMDDLRSQMKTTKDHSLDLSHEFNSCTILPYCKVNDIKAESSMGWHTDSKYDKNHKFSESKNSQVQNAPVVIVSYGTHRGLHWRRVVLTKDGRKEDKSWNKMIMLMSETSYMLLHPLDEVPRHFKHRHSVYRYQHGKVKIEDPESFSVAFVFRVVSSYHKYDVLTNRMVVSSMSNRTSKKQIHERKIIYSKCKDLVVFHCSTVTIYKKIRDNINK